MTKEIPVVIALEQTKLSPPEESVQAELHAVTVTRLLHEAVTPQEKPAQIQNILPLPLATMTLTSSVSEIMPVDNSIPDTVAKSDNIVVAVHGDAAAISEAPIHDAYPLPQMTVLLEDEAHPVSIDSDVEDALAVVVDTVILDEKRPVVKKVRPLKMNAAHAPIVYNDLSLAATFTIDQPNFDQPIFTAPTSQKNRCACGKTCTSRRTGAAHGCCDDLGRAAATGSRCGTENLARQCAPGRVLVSTCYR